MLARGYSLVILLLATAGASADNWPCWRGPRNDGQSAERNLPAKWSAGENVLWKAPLPDVGNSTPIVWGDRIFLTQAMERGRSRGLLCFARADGKLLWQRMTEYREKERTHEDNPFCSGSPVTDGERVIACLGSAGLVCYDLDGKELWRRDLGAMRHTFGTAHSPLLYGDLVILWYGPGPGQKLLAFDRRNGKTVWEHDEPRGKFEDPEHPDELAGSWATPIVVPTEQGDELVLPLPGKLKGFDPKTGKELWWCDGLGIAVYPTPVCCKGVVVAFSGCEGPALAVKPGGRGDVTKTHREWWGRRRNPQRIGSPVVVDNRICLVTESGEPQSIEVETGTQLWESKERMLGRTYGSMVAADGKLYATSTDGVTLVLKAGPKLEVIARNAIGEPVYASPAVADGRIYLRSHKHLWCIGSSK
jgi:outer membrane protein assembly factor BamB